MKKTGRVGLRVTPMEKTFWEIRAGEEGLSLAAWIAKTLNHEIGLELKSAKTAESRQNRH